MDSFKVSDEGGGIVRIDAQTRLMRKPMATAICAEVDELVEGREGFKILMNMGAISKGTPGAGLYVLGSMKKYPLTGLALFGANGFMRGMAKVVLGAARFSNFEIFDEEAPARHWLEGAGPAPAGGPAEGPSRGLRRAALPAGALALGAVLMRARRRRAGGMGSPTSG